MEDFQKFVTVLIGLAVYFAIVIFGLGGAVYLTWNIFIPALVQVDPISFGDSVRFGLGVLMWLWIVKVFLQGVKLDA